MGKPFYNEGAQTKAEAKKKVERPEDDPSYCNTVKKFKIENDAHKNKKSCHGYARNILGGVFNIGKE